jgi:DNA-binding transcriptional LysR family regulator
MACSYTKILLLTLQPCIPFAFSSEYGALDVAASLAGCGLMQRFTEVRSLVAIVTLSEELSFTRAAKRIEMSQSGLSRHLSAFERQNHIKLFERDHANVALTDAGRAFVEEAKISLLHNEKALQAAQATREGVESTLTVGRSPFADPLLTSTLLSTRLPLYPHLRLSLHSDFAPELIHDLLVAKLDVALVANPGPNKKLTMTQVSESPLYVVLPEGCSLADQKTVTLRDLREYRWMLFERKAHPRMFDAILRRAHEEEIVVRDGVKFLNAEEAAQLVSEDLGVAFLTETGARRVAERGAIVKPLSDPELMLTIFIASRADNNSKLVSEFVRGFMRRATLLFKPPQMVLPMTN